MFSALPCDDIVVPLLYGGRLCVVGGDQLVLEGSDGLDALLLEGLEAGVEGLLLGEEGLHGGQVTAVVLRVNLRGREIIALLS